MDDSDYDFTTSATKITNFFKKPLFKLSHSNFDKSTSDYQKSTSLAKSKAPIDAETIRSYAQKAPTIIDSPYNKTYYLNLRKELTADNNEHPPFAREKYEVGDKLKEEELVDYTKKFGHRTIIPPELKEIDVDYAAKSNFPISRPNSAQGLRDPEHASWIKHKPDHEYGNHWGKNLDVHRSRICGLKNSETSMINSPWKSLEDGEKIYNKTPVISPVPTAATPSNDHLTSVGSTPPQHAKFKLNGVQNYEDEDDETYKILKNTSVYKEWAEARFNMDARSQKSDEWY